MYTLKFIHESRGRFVSLELSSNAGNGIIHDGMLMLIYIVNKKGVFYWHLAFGICVWNSRL